ncbi:Asp23/Gls24 family envelope stress response protein [Corynebacterium incognita]|uniref:Asp23/Gls24 family envelope stress response protein n=1 Tax=Corynebacterium incognita TaxID=2754725 RepID=A0A7G7CMT5_9CORY|nr:Asp23/Gls24 family envelope stress response protein [Corynebacterium incognita]QNE88901.1 Asp23/Gls24 family envelope stress response protein [Corynebacterium incognita]
MAESTTSLGDTIIEPKVIEKLAATAVRSVPGTVETEAKLGGIAGRSFPRFHVQVDNTHCLASVDAFLAVSWPSPTTHVAATVRQAIADALAVYAGFETSRINVEIGQARPGRRVHSTDLRRPAFYAARPRYRELNAWSPQVRQQHALARPAVPQPGPLRPVTVRPAAALKEITTLPPQPLRPITVTRLFAPGGDAS